MYHIENTISPLFSIKAARHSAQKNYIILYNLHICPKIVFAAYIIKKSHIRQNQNNKENCAAAAAWAKRLIT